jgi:hypothetical protein
MECDPEPSGTNSSYARVLQAMSNVVMVLGCRGPQQAVDRYSRQFSLQPKADREAI